LTYSKGTFGRNAFTTYTLVKLPFRSAGVELLAIFRPAAAAQAVLRGMTHFDPKLACLWIGSKT